MCVCVCVCMHACQVNTSLYLAAHHNSADSNNFTKLSPPPPGIELTIHISSSIHQAEIILYDQGGKDVGGRTLDE